MDGYELRRVNMADELKQIHNFLMQVNVSGENTILIAESLVRLRRVIQEAEQLVAEQLESES